MGKVERQLHLPPPSQSGRLPLEEAIFRRKSVRNFKPDIISERELSQLLWAAQGITSTRGERRAAPSAGATYPLELFVACGKNCVAKLEEGLYHYHPTDHSLVRLHDKDLRFELAQAAQGQGFIYQAPLDIVVCAILKRTSGRYGERAERYINIEVGHAGQNIYLQAAALGLGTVAVGAFDDEEVRKTLRLDVELRPLYIMPVGRPG